MVLQRYIMVNKLSLLGVCLQYTLQREVIGRELERKQWCPTLYVCMCVCVLQDRGSTRPEVSNVERV